jgi:hypothetical protein
MMAEEYCWAVTKGGTVILQPIRFQCIWMYISNGLSRTYILYKVVQIWTGRIFFFLNHTFQTLTCTFQSSTYSPPESTHFFQRSGSILMPFSKKACGWRPEQSRWRRRFPQTALWSTYTTQTHGSVTDTLPHTVVGDCGEFQRTGRFLRGIWSQCVVPLSAVPSVRSSL